MSNPFDYFQKIYCCTIPQNTERIEFMEAQAKKFDIKIEYMLGTYSPGSQTAVTENHLKAYWDALKNGYSRVLVLEDDCEFLPEIGSLEEILKEWELLLEYTPLEILYLGGWVMGDNHPIGNHINWVSRITCLHSYIPTIGLMQKLIQEPYTTLYNSKPLDLILSEGLGKDFEGCVVRPLMTRQWPSFSNVRGKFDNKDNMQQWSREALKNE